MLSDDIFHNILILLSTIIFGYIIYDKFFNNNNGKQRKNVNTKSYSTKDEKSIKNNNINISSNNNNNMVENEDSNNNKNNNDDGDNNNNTIDDRNNNYNDADGNLPPHPIFPQVKITDESRGPENSRKVPANARRPVPFKNDNFAGQILILLKTDPADPYWEHHFSGKKRLVEVRVQGKFLKKPRGPLFFGGEITSPMSLGFVLGPLARLMLKIVAGISTGLFHASFATSEPDERPHICTSFFGGMDQVIVTKNGDPLPNLMEQVKEDPEARKARRRSTDAFDCDLNATYTFSFHDMRVDLLNWRITRLVKDVDLHSFWEDQPLRLCLYDVKGVPDRHLNQDKRYYLCIQFEHIIGAENNEKIDWPDSNSDDVDNNNISNNAGDNTNNGDLAIDLDSKMRRRVSSRDSSSPVSQSISVPAWIEYSDQTNKRVAYLFLVSTKAKRHFVLRTVREIKELIPSLDGDFKDELKSLVSSSKMSRDTSKLSRHSYFERKRRSLDLIVQAHCASTRKNRIAINHFVKDRTNGLEHIVLRRTVEKDRFKVLSRRPSSTFANIFLECSVLFAEWETFWREGWAALAKCSSSSDDYGGDNNDSNDNKGNVNVPSPKYEMLFYRVHSTKPYMRIPCDAVMDVRMLPRDTGIPFNGRADCCFEVKTLGRVYTFLTASMELATEWVEILNQKCSNSNAYRYDLDVVAALDPRDMFALKSRRYTTPGKVILNAGRLCFPTVQKRRLSLNSSSTDVDNMNLMIGNNNNDNNNSVGFDDSNSDNNNNNKGKNETAGSFTSSNDNTNSSTSNNNRSYSNGAKGKHIDPCLLSAKLLRAALAIPPKSDLSSKEDVEKFQVLLYYSSQLRDVDSRLLLEDDEDLKQTKLLVFWLNIYHALLVQATFIIGNQKTMMGFLKFTKDTCYEIFREPYRDIYSLIDIEHGILRAHSKGNKTGLMKIVTPVYNKKKPKWDFAVPINEPRVSFVLNTGRMSSLSQVPVFTVSKLDSQLNRACEQYLSSFVRMELNKRVIIFPYIVDFYKKDFGDGSPAATINFVASLMGRKGDLFRRFIRTPGSLTVKYDGFSFNARKDALTALWPPEAEETESASF